jgi:hypothetical protein
MDKLAELLRQGADKLINLPSEAQRFVTNPQAFTQLLTGKNPLPRETGFAAGATGLPAQEMSVLDPNQAPYMQGYSQGEPIGYAGMAAPFAAPAAVATAKALAPKAGMMAENYMVKQGMIQPLTAYHGTPHTIQGQFDINKVGTGEGAQAYGHGMYFAESPVVASKYRNALSNVDMSAKGQPLTAFGVDERVVTHSPNIFDKPLDYGLAEYNKSLKAQLVDYPELKNDPNYAKELFDQRVEFLKSWGKGSKEAQAGEALENFAKANGYPDVNMGGNLYKVDIPDADIPFMLDYDKPLSQQPKAVQKALADIDPDLYSKKGNDYDPSETGQIIYQRLSQMDMNKNGPFTGASKNVSNMLNAKGIKGIRYKDEMSRGFDKGTSNFVIFEPSTVKILEKNNQPVTRKELIEQQLNDLNSGN